MSKYFTIFNTRSETENYEIKDVPWTGVILDERTAIFSQKAYIIGQEVDVWLTDCGTQKLNVMKVVKTRLGLGLREAKELVDRHPCCIKQRVPIEEALVLKDQIEEAGGKVEFK